MRIHGTLILLGALTVLAGCGPVGQNPNTSYLPGSTGYFDSDGIDYVHNGDPYILNREKDGVDTPPPASPSAPAQKQGNTLKDRIKEFEVSRFNDGNSEAQRFGKSSFKLTVFFREKTSVTFSGRLTDTGDAYHFDAATGDYHLQGDFLDDEKNEKTTTRGFFLTNTKTKDQVEISYVASKVLLSAYTQTDQKIAPGSLFECQLKVLRDNDHLDKWVNNWNVINGPSFYIYDFVKHIKPGETDLDCLPDNFTIKGESKRTSLSDKTITHPAEASDQSIVSKAELVGNSATTNQRMLEVTLQDQKTHEQNQVVLVADPANAQDQQPVILPDEQPIEYGPADDSTPQVSPTPAAPAPQTQIQPKASTSSLAYLREDTRLARTARMAHDYRRNSHVPGVLKLMRQMQDQHSDMQNFIDYGYPFRGVLEAISQAYDVSPMFAYLSYGENTYFRGGQYSAPDGDLGNPDHAVGPFQIHTPAAKDGGMSGMSLQRGPGDERHYLMTSACGAAQYLIQTSEHFRKGDMTFGILGYNQGSAGAVRHIKRATHTAEAFSISYSTMESHGSLPQALQTYINRALAVYFILSDMPRYGFSIGPNAQTSFPNNGTVLPPKGISNPKCQAVVGPFLSAGA